jgi:hypothetical protein
MLIECSKCKGTGRIVFEPFCSWFSGSNPPLTDSIECLLCSGSGKIDIDEQVDNAINTLSYDPLDYTSNNVASDICNIFGLDAVAFDDLVAAVKRWKEKANG